mmetsp:Transcript_67465/g.163076  ORF Transcript_67465/g.163076 Transcript_67465/m.163076 type:complete len:298 (+) Transcript_67465:714-1607(+)
MEELRVDRLRLPRLRERGLHRRGRQPRGRSGPVHDEPARVLGLLQGVPHPDAQPQPEQDRPALRHDRLEELERQPAQPAARLRALRVHGGARAPLGAASQGHQGREGHWHDAPRLHREPHDGPCAQVRDAGAQDRAIGARLAHHADGAPRQQAARDGAPQDLPQARQGRHVQGDDGAAGVHRPHRRLGRGRRRRRPALEEAGARRLHPLPARRGHGRAVAQRQGPVHHAHLPRVHGGSRPRRALQVRSRQDLHGRAQGARDVPAHHRQSRRPRRGCAAAFTGRQRRRRRPPPRRPRA